MLLLHTRHIHLVHMYMGGACALDPAHAENDMLKHICISCQGTADLRKLDETARKGDVPTQKH